MTSKFFLKNAQDEIEGNVADDSLSEEIESPPIPIERNYHPRNVSVDREGHARERLQSPGRDSESGSETDIQSQAGSDGSESGNESQTTEGYLIICFTMLFR